MTDYLIERELAFLLADAARKLNDAYDQEMKPLDLTRSQWRLMAYISRTPGVSQTELADTMECTRMAITGLLDRMQAKGLVERRPVANDRRLRAVFLSRQGRALVKRMNETAVAVLDRIFTGTTPADRECLKRLLETIKTNASTMIESSTSNQGEENNGTGRV